MENLYIVSVYTGYETPYENVSRYLVKAVNEEEAIAKAEKREVVLHHPKMTSNAELVEFDGDNVHWLDTNQR